MCKGTCHAAGFCLGDAEKFKEECARAYPGVNPDDMIAAALAREAKRLIGLSEECKSLHDSVEKAAAASYPKLSARLAQIPCMGGYAGTC